MATALQALRSSTNLYDGVSDEGMLRHIQESYYPDKSFEEVGGMFGYSPASTEEATVEDKPWTDDAKEIGGQLAGGLMVDFNRQVGQAAKAFTDEGSYVNDWAKGVVKRADERAPNYQPNLEGRGFLAETLIKGARSVPSSAAIAGAAVLGGTIGAPVAASSLAALALFGGSQYQDTYEKAKEQGVSDEEANQAGLLTGAIQGGLEAAANTLTLGALGMTGKALSKTVSGFLGKATDDAVVKPWLVATGKNIAGQVITEPMQDVGTAFVEQDYGIDKNPDYLGIAKESAQGALGMSAFFGLPGLAGHYQNAQRAKAIDTLIANPEAGTQEERLALVDMLHKEASSLNIPDVDVWARAAKQDVLENNPIRRSIQPDVTDVTNASSVDEAIQAANNALRTPDARTLELRNYALNGGLQKQEEPKALEYQRKLEEPEQRGNIPPETVINFPDGSTTTAYDYFQQRLEGHGDANLARQEMFQALNTEKTVQPKLLEDSGIIFSGAEARNTQLADKLAQALSPKQQETRKKLNAVKLNAKTVLPQETQPATQETASLPTPESQISPEVTDAAYTARTTTENNSAATSFDRAVTPENTGVGRTLDDGGNGLTGRGTGGNADGLSRTVQQSAVDSEPGRALEGFTPEETSAIVNSGAKNYTNYARARYGAERIRGRDLNKEWDALNGKGQNKTTQATEEAVNESAKKPVDNRAPILPGDTFKTVSGRITSPYPKYSQKKETKSQKIEANQWLINEYIAEAKYRSDSFNQTLAKGLDAKNFTVSDSESVNEYVFGDYEGRIGKFKVNTTTGINDKQAIEDEQSTQTPTPRTDTSRNETPVGSSKAEPDVLGEEEVTAYPDFNEIAKEYGKSIANDGEIIHKNDKPSGVVVKRKGGRVRIESKSDGKLLASGGDEKVISNFIEKFWLAEKIKTQSQPETPTKESSVTNLAPNINDKKYKKSDGTIDLDKYDKDEADFYDATVAPKAEDYATASEYHAAKLQWNKNNTKENSAAIVRQKRIAAIRKRMEAIDKKVSDTNKKTIVPPAIRNEVTAKLGKEREELEQELDGLINESVGSQKQTQVEPTVASSKTEPTIDDIPDEFKDKVKYPIAQGDKTIKVSASELIKDLDKIIADYKKFIECMGGK